MAAAAGAAGVGAAAASAPTADDEGSGGASFALLKQCFSRRIDELQELLDLRVDGE
jgi:hypothetical protein